MRSAEQHRLTPLKRSPPSAAPQRKPSQPATTLEYSLDRTPALYHGQKVLLGAGPDSDWEDK